MYERPVLRWLALFLLAAGIALLLVPQRKRSSLLGWVGLASLALATVLYALELLGVLGP